jgi:predicted DNA-binding transcriptional regulator YafY
MPDIMQPQTQPAKGMTAEEAIAIAVGLRETSERLDLRPPTPALLAARAHAECAAALRIVNRIHAVMPQCGGRDDLAAAMRSLM